MIETLVDTALFNYARARSVGFTLEYLILDTLGRLVPGGKKDENFTLKPEEFKRVRVELERLLRDDARNIREGVYPLAVLFPENPKAHLKRLPLIAFDGLSLYLRRATGRTTEFSKRAKDFLEELPRYYRRNFHFQTDGYLSRRSAEIYEHQVEMLFGGAADAMRRLIIRPLRERFGEGDGKGLTFLEVGAGTGRTTRFVRLAFPRAKIVTTDLSDPYLKEAQRKLATLNRVDFLQADAAKLPFQDGFFDAAYSVFLYHELPLADRKSVLQEARRVVKPGGFFGFVDSAQLGDIEGVDGVLERFPKQFHEPYYRNYIENKMEPLLEEAGFTGLHSDHGFLSKVVSASNG